MWAGLPEPRDCGVHAIVLCVIRGLEPSLLLFLAISSQGIHRPHYYLVTLLSWLHNVLPVASWPIRLLTRCLLHLSYAITLDVAFPFRGLVLVIWFMPCAARHIIHTAYGVTSFRFVQAATAHHHQHSVALLPLLATGTHHFFVAYCLFLPRSPNHCASACHSSINRLSGLHPSLYCCAYSRAVFDSSLVICSRWCRIRTCDVSHIPDTCVPAFVHSANHLAFYLIVSPRRSPSCTMRSSFIFG